MRAPIAAAALLLAAAAPLPHAHQPQIAITIDDLPVHAPYPPGIRALEVNRRMIAALKAAHVPATAFVNAVNVKDAATMEALREWRAAGFILANHTWSHPHLSELTIAEFEQELARDEPILRKLGGRSGWRWFRYPFLEEGKDQAQRLAARRILASRGYKVAGVTMTFSDWAFTPAYTRCMAKGDTQAVASLERLYLQAARENIAASRDMARKLFDRDIPYVLLMHDSAMSAHMMPQVIRLYRQAGFRFVSLPQAERDPAYAGYTDLKGPPPPTSQELAERRHVELSPPADHSAELNSICT